jgi:hypothetical protein
MMKLFKRTFTMLAFLFITVLMFGQGSTTSSMSGKIVDKKGEILPGATIVAVHVPSGTTYGSITNNTGLFTIQGMRPGGPYKVEISFIGYSKKTFTEINLSLGETYALNTDLTESSTELNEVVVVGVKPSKFNNTKTGATTNISSAQMIMLPTISRSINDIARVSPYSNGMSFSGGDGRSTNFTVDGSNLNNNFGLSSSLPGGGNPISLDAIEEVQVVIAPFDVRQTNFIGGGINAITKSGTNTIKASVYSYLKNQNMRGNKVADKDLGTRAKESNSIYGFTLGAPIIKDKLFIFGNLEYEKSPQQVIYWRASTDGITDLQTISRTKESDLQTVSDYLKTKYNYETGSYKDFPADVTNLKYLIRLDWNINAANKLNIRFNHTKNSGWNAPNGNSTDGSYRDQGKNRVGSFSMSYANSMYSMDNIVNSGSLELNSRLSKSMSNQLLMTYSDIKDVRGSTSTPFPFIDIMSGDIATGAAALDPYISAGYELFTWNNGVKNKIITVNDNFTYYLNAHKLTAGLSYENQFADNNYMRNGTGYYRYKSMSDFLTGKAPVDFALTYGTNGALVPSNAVKFNQIGAYVQDEWSPVKNLKLTLGFRADNLSFVDDIMTNNAILNLDFGGRHIDTGIWPKAKINLSPRLGLTWDVKGDKSLVVRGGTGMFMGRLPLVFFTNMPTNAGMSQILMKLQTKFNATTGAVTSVDPKLALLAGDMITDVNKMISTLGFQTIVTPADGSVPSSIAGVDPKFSMPQVWKSSAAVDYKLPVSFPFSATAEGIFTKNINAVMLDNYAVKNPDATWTRFAGPDNRYIFPASYLYNTVKDACVLTNTDKGYGYTLNLTLNAEPVKNLELMFAYTKTEMKEISGMPGSNANSAWVGLYTIDGPNNATIQRSQYVVPDKVIGSVSYRIPYLNDHMATTLSLFYSGFTPYGNSFRYSNDMNGDGNIGDLIYIPKAKGDIVFLTTADEDAFFNFMEQDKYLSSHKGQYAEANAARSLWVDRFDLRLVQDFSVKAGNQKNTLQLSLDVLNAGNLLSPRWGVYKNMAASNYGAILKYEGKDAGNVPRYSMVQVNGAYPTKTYDYYKDNSQCWRLQLGIRYIFN